MRQAARLDSPNGGTLAAVYYDRRIPLDLRELLNGPLAWMVDWLRSREAEAAHARLDFRRARGTRRHGGLQVYLGRTSPLEVLGSARGAYKLTAHDRYKTLTPELFAGRMTAVDLADRESLLRRHLATVAATADPTFLTSEARPHGGLMRTYGLDHAEGAPLLAVDSEVRLGFDDQSAADAFRHTVRARLGSGERIPSKLDALGVLPDGRPALVEVKKPGGDIESACYQLATYMMFFEALAATGHDLQSVLEGTIAQKQAVGLIPETAPRAITSSRPVPVIAAPDHRPDWRERWVAQTAAREGYGDLLDDLRFWRLSEDGVVLEEGAP